MSARRQEEGVKVVTQSFVVTIPTLNSQRTLGRAIDSLALRDHPELTCSVVDSGSKDATVSIAREKGADVYEIAGGILEARFVGTQRTSAPFVILMDSDQILCPDAICRIANAIRTTGADMLILGESSWNPQTYVQRMYARDRDTLHRALDVSSRPRSGVLLPRVFRTSLLLQVFKAIQDKLNPEAFTTISAHDHAIIYAEAASLSSLISYVPKAILHEEPKSLGEVFRHFRHYGSNTANFLKSSSVYQDLTRQSLRGREDLLARTIISELPALPMLTAKAAGYWWGFLTRT